MSCDIKKIFQPFTSTWLLDVLGASGVFLCWKERQYRNLFIYMASCQLTKPEISPHHTWVRRAVVQEVKAGTSRSLSWSQWLICAGQQPQHEICPWNKPDARGEVSTELEKNYVCASPLGQSSGSTFLLVWSSARRWTLDHSDVIQKSLYYWLWIP